MVDPLPDPNQLPVRIFRAFGPCRGDLQSGEVLGPVVNPKPIAIARIEHIGPWRELIGVVDDDPFQPRVCPRRFGELAGDVFDAGPAPDDDASGPGPAGEPAGTAGFVGVVGFKRAGAAGSLSCNARFLAASRVGEGRVMLAFVIGWILPGPPSSSGFPARDSVSVAAGAALSSADPSGPTSPRVANS